MKYVTPESAGTGEVSFPFRIRQFGREFPRLAVGSFKLTLLARVSVPPG